VHRLIGQYEQDGRAYITPVNTPAPTTALAATLRGAPAPVPTIMRPVRMTTRATLAARPVPATFWPAFKLLERTSIFVSHLVSLGRRHYHDISRYAQLQP
jgi:hypothetical protein